MTVLRELEEQAEELSPDDPQDSPQRITTGTPQDLLAGIPQDLAAGPPVRPTAGSFVEALREWTTRRG